MLPSALVDMYNLLSDTEVLTIGDTQDSGVINEWLACWHSEGTRDAMTAFRIAMAFLDYHTYWFESSLERQLMAIRSSKAAAEARDVSSDAWRLWGQAMVQLFATTNEIAKPIRRVRWWKKPANSMLLASSVPPASSMPPASANGSDTTGLTCLQAYHGLQRFLYTMSSQPESPDILFVALCMMPRFSSGFGDERSRRTWCELWPDADLLAWSQTFAVMRKFIGTYSDQLLDAGGKQLLTAVAENADDIERTWLAWGIEYPGPGVNYESWSFPLRETGAISWIDD
ncbi:MAG: hypothetical protein ACYDHD_06610 [Vulcanimicrobiaceae bacterium]